MASAARVLHVPESGPRLRLAEGTKSRQNVDDGARFERDVLGADAGLFLDKAAHRAGASDADLARALGISRPKVTRWRTEPQQHPPQLRAVLAHPAVSVEAAALLLARVAEQLAASTQLEIADGLVRVRAAVERLDALVARRGER